jgi:hypothetical protein
MEESRRNGKPPLSLIRIERRKSMKGPKDTVIFMAADARRDLRVCGITRRDLAGTKLTALLRANGFDPLDWKVESTITVPKHPRAVETARRHLYPRAAERHRRYYDNRSCLISEAIGSLVMYAMTRDEADTLMSSTRAALRACLASGAAVA